MPPCLTPFETVKKQDQDWPHLMHISWLLQPKDQHSNNQQRNFANNKLITELPVINTIKCLGRI